MDLLMMNNYALCLRVFLDFIFLKALRLFLEPAVCEHDFDQAAPFNGWFNKTGAPVEPAHWLGAVV